MTVKPQQLVFNLLKRPAMGRDDFLVTTSNQAAVNMIDQWPHWPTRGAIITGPSGSGKSHLVEVWRQKTGARRLPAPDLTIENTPLLLDRGSIALEDVTPDHFDNTAFFHLLNLTKQLDVTVLFTSSLHPDQWQVKLLDLKSRLKTLPVIDILSPDDMLLRAVLVKLFLDRQISIKEEVISYILTRMPRSLAAARMWVAEIDRYAMIERAEITRPFVARMLPLIEMNDQEHQNEISSS